MEINILKFYRIYFALSQNSQYAMYVENLIKLPNVTYDKMFGNIQLDRNIDWIFQIGSLYKQ